MARDSRSYRSNDSAAPAAKPFFRNYYPSDRTPDAVDVIEARQALTAPSTRRNAVDRERDAVLMFTEKHPEYAKLGHDVVAQALATMRTPAEADIEQGLDDCGARRWTNSRREETLQ
jgi:hypothetical protein